MTYGPQHMPDTNGNDLGNNTLVREKTENTWEEIKETEPKDNSSEKEPGQVRYYVDQSWRRPITS